MIPEIEMGNTAVQKQSNFTRLTLGVGWPHSNRHFSIKTTFKNDEEIFFELQNTNQESLSGQN